MPRQKLNEDIAQTTGLVVDGVGDSHEAVAQTCVLGLRVFRAFFKHEMFGLPMNMIMPMAGKTD